MFRLFVVVLVNIVLTFSSIIEVLFGLNGTPHLEAYDTHCCLPNPKNKTKVVGVGSINDNKLNTDHRATTAQSLSDKCNAQFTHEIPRREISKNAGKDAVLNETNYLSQPQDWIKVDPKGWDIEKQSAYLALLQDQLKLERSLTQMLIMNSTNTAMANFLRDISHLSESSNMNNTNGFEKEADTFNPPLTPEEQSIIRSIRKKIFP